MDLKSISQQKQSLIWVELQLVRKSWEYVQLFQTVDLSETPKKVIDALEKLSCTFENRWTIKCTPLYHAYNSENGVYAAEYCDRMQKILVVKIKRRESKFIWKCAFIDEYKNTNQYVKIVVDDSLNSVEVGPVKTKTVDRKMLCFNPVLEESGWFPIKTAPYAGEFFAYGSYHYGDDKSPTEYWHVASRTSNIQYPWETEEGMHPEGYLSHWRPLSRPKN